jgi:hypothetical protein
MFHRVSSPSTAFTHYFIISRNFLETAINIRPPAGVDTWDWTTNKIMP